MIKLAPSILSADFSKLGEQVQEVEKAGATLLHIDVMDGHFVPNITIGSLVVKSLRPISKLIFDVHLMIEHPLKYIEDFSKSGADIITVHVEAKDDLIECINLIKSLGKKAGAVINPNTNVEAIEPVLHMLDMVLVMSVYPGFGGQKYINEVEDKITFLRNRMGDDFDIEIDGGINADTIKYAVKAGANVIVAGAAVFCADGGITNSINQLMKLGNEVCEQ